MKILGQDMQSPVRDLHPGPPKYVGVLTTRPRRSVTIFFVNILKFSDGKGIFMKSPWAVL
jgi:hypothetical protein